MRVFLSVAGPERPKVEPVALALRGQGFDVFLDEQVLEPGANYHRRIRDEILRADLAVFFISATSISPGRYTMSELEIMQSRWKHPAGRVLPVMIESVSYDRVPSYLQAVTVSRPKGNLAASVAHEVTNMAVALQRLREERLRATGQAGSGPNGDLLRPIFGAAAFAVLTAMVCFVINGQVLLADELLGSLPHDVRVPAYIVLRASVLAVLFGLSALFLHVRALNHYLGLIAGAMAAYATHIVLGGYSGGVEPALVDTAKSLVLFGVLAAIVPGYRTPVAGIGIVAAGLFAGVVGQGFPAARDFLWEAAMVAASIMVLSTASPYRKRMAT